MSKPLVVLAALALLLPACGGESSSDDVQDAADDGAAEAPEDDGDGHRDEGRDADDAGRAEDETEADTGEPTCGNGVLEAGEECDGDEPRACDTACGTEGTRACADCAWETACSLPALEACDGMDDDCDTAIDEDYPTLGTPCDGPDTDGCANGVLVCAAGATSVECGPESASDLPETCDGLDDDCDTLTDEDFPTLGEVCDGIDADGCANGVLVCAADGSGTECGPELPADIMESCDGLDNDCDTELDEPDAEGCTLYYADADGDTYGDPGTYVCLCASDPAFPSTNGSDCCDSDASVNPGQGTWFTAANACGTWDYDCSGTAERRFTAFGHCGDFFDCSGDTGWEGSAVPACGSVGSWVTGCSLGFFSCDWDTADVTQQCR